MDYYDKYMKYKSKYTFLRNNKKPLDLNSRSKMNLNKIINSKYVHLDGVEYSYIVPSNNESMEEVNRFIKNNSVKFVFDETDLPTIFFVAKLNNKIIGLIAHSNLMKRVNACFSGKARLVMNEPDDVGYETNNVLVSKQFRTNSINERYKIFSNLFYFYLNNIKEDTCWLFTTRIDGKSEVYKSFGFEYLYNTDDTLYDFGPLRVLQYVMRYRKSNKIIGIPDNVHSVKTIKTEMNGIESIINALVAISCIKYNKSITILSDEKYITDLIYKYVIIILKYYYKQLNEFKYSIVDTSDKLSSTRFIDWCNRIDNVFSLDLPRIEAKKLQDKEYKYDNSSRTVKIILDTITDECDLNLQSAKNLLDKSPDMFTMPLPFSKFHQKLIGIDNHYFNIDYYTTNIFINKYTRDSNSDLDTLYSNILFNTNIFKIFKNYYNLDNCVFSMITPSNKVNSKDYEWDVYVFNKYKENDEIKKQYLVLDDQMIDTETKIVLDGIKELLNMSSYKVFLSNVISYFILNESCNTIIIKKILDDVILDSNDLDSLLNTIFYSTDLKYIQDYYKFIDFFIKLLSKIPDYKIIKLKQWFANNKILDKLSNRVVS